MKTILIFLALNTLIGFEILINKPIAYVYADDLFTAVDSNGQVIDENYCLDSLDLDGYKVILKFEP